MSRIRAFFAILSLFAVSSLASAQNMQELDSALRDRGLSIVGSELNSAP